MYPSNPTEPSEIDYSLPYQIFTIGGCRINAEVEDLTPGIYIVRQSSVSKKNSR